jgi:Ca2+-binding EF-hand superfamily protein
MNSRTFGPAGLAVSVLAAIWACSDSGQETSSLGQEEAALVAAVAASEDAVDDSGSELGAEPFWVKGCGFGAILNQIRVRFDADGDGALSRDERAAIAQEFGDPVERVALLLGLYDGDESGALDAAELGQLQSDVEARCRGREVALIARFDTDGDGQLSDAEREAARAALEARFGRRHLGRRIRGDAGAGIGDPGEYPRDRRERVRSRFDADGDGTLDREERRAFGEHMRGCVRGEHPMHPDDEPTPPLDEPTPPVDESTPPVEDEPSQPDAGLN